MISTESKTGIINKFARSSTDTGSTEVQVALLTERIRQISDHLKLFPKDNHSRRGLLKLVGRRKRFYKYLQRVDRERFEALKNLQNVAGA